jgi:hypothetical protein
MNEIGGACSTYSREESRIQESLVGKPDWKRRLGRPRLRWNGNIKIDVKEVD